MTWLRRCWEEHALSFVIVAIWAALIGLSMWRFDGTWGEWFSERAGGHSDDSFGALLLIILTKWLRERNSNASN